VIENDYRNLLRSVLNGGGYFGCRSKEGGFDLDLYVDR